MPLTLDDILGAPSDPEELTKHLQGRGLIPSPIEAPSSIAPATVGALSAVTPASAVAPMVKPKIEKSPGSPDWTGLEMKHLPHPGAPTHNMDMTEAPELAAINPTPPGELGAGNVATMKPPTLTHSEKMALPQLSAGIPDIGSSDFTRNQLERLQEQKEHPWGTAENHPGILGKIGHVASRVGNIAADILAPGLALNIPGSDMNKMAEEHGLKNELAERTAAEGKAKNLQSEEDLRGVQTEEGRAKLDKAKNEQELVKDAEGNVTGYKGPNGVLHSLDEEGTPQAIKDIAEESKNKPRYETDKNNGNIIQLTRQPDGSTKADVVYKGQPNVKTETRSILGADGKAHDKVFDITPGTANFGKELADLGRAKEDKAPSLTHELAQSKADEEIVIGYDKQGRQKLMSHAQAKDEGLQHIVKASGKERDDAMQNTSVLNDMGAKIKNLHSNREALNQSAYEKGLISTALSHGPDSMMTTGAIKFMSPKSKAYVQDVFSLREAALALPKQLTGGSRVSEVQAQALWNTIPGVGGDDKYAEQQLKKFDENLTRLWKKVPLVEGNEQEHAFPEENKGGGGGTVKIGGKEIQLGADGTFEQGGHTYKVTPGSKQATLVK